MFTLFCIAHGCVVTATVILAAAGPTTLFDWMILLGFSGVSLMAIPLGENYIRSKVKLKIEEGK